MSIEGLEFEIFAGGGAFFISNSLMKKIYPLIDDFNKEWLNYYRSGKLPESCYACGDVALSFLVKKYFDLKLSHVEGMYSQNPNFYPSIVENPLTFHYIPAHEMLSIYDKYSYL
jgi:hypothetical protein